MISFFTIPRAFEGDVGVRQRNSLGSLCRLMPPCQIILIGDERGVGVVAHELGLTHVAVVERNEFGTPLLSSAFRSAQAAARFSTMSYLNADIMLLDDFVAAVRRIHFRKYLMCGRRWNVDIAGAVDVDTPEWADRLRDHAQRSGTLFTHSAMDYFVFPRGMLLDIPPFAVGRPRWDNWMIYNARAKGIPVIDATAAVMAIHQNHDYVHVKQSRGLWTGPEGDSNLDLAGGWDNLFSLHDATWILDGRRLRRARGPEHRARWPEARRVLHPRRARLLANAARWRRVAFWKGLYWRMTIRIKAVMRRGGGSATRSETKGELRDV